MRIVFGVSVGLVGLGVLGAAIALTGAFAIGATLLCIGFLFACWGSNLLINNPKHKDLDPISLATAGRVFAGALALQAIGITLAIVGFALMMLRENLWKLAALL